MEGHDLWVYNNHISKCLDSLDCNLAAEGFFFWARIQIHQELMYLTASYNAVSSNPRTLPV
jgi:hypothetical protein